MAETCMEIEGLASVVDEWAAVKPTQRNLIMARAFDKLYTHDCPVMIRHGKGERLVVGVASFQVMPAGLDATIRLHDTAAGLAAAQDVADQVLRGLSASIAGDARDTEEGGILRRTYSQVDRVSEISLVPRPAFRDCLIRRWSWCGAMAADELIRTYKRNGRIAMARAALEARHADELMALDMRQSEEMNMHGSRRNAELSLIPDGSDRWVTTMARSLERGKSLWDQHEHERDQMIERQARERRGAQ